MEYLKQAWAYRFWIAIGIVVLMPIIGYFGSTRTLAASARQRAEQLKGRVSKLENLKKGPTPNEQYVAGVNERKEVLSQQVDGAWIDLYKRQEPIMDWPKEVMATYQAKGPKGEVDPNTRVTYQGLYISQLQDLLARIQPVGLPGSKGLVEMDVNVLGKYAPGWSQPGAPVPPSVPDAWLAQEDIWLLRALVDVIVRANQGSAKWEESPVKRVLDIQMGKGAEDASTKAKTSKDQWYTFDGVLAGAAAASKSATGAARYLNVNKLYSEIPVHMVLTVDQRQILKVLAAFNNSNVPLQIRQVEFYKDSQRAPVVSDRATGKAASRAPSKDVDEEVGEAPLREDEYFHMTELHIHARAIFYKKPDKLAEAERTKVQAAAPPATQGGAAN